jgi:hypothetical protein
LLDEAVEMQYSVRDFEIEIVHPDFPVITAYVDLLVMR